MVHPKPFLWEENRALNFFQIYNKVCVNHPKGHLISREMIVLIFFEETAFSNVRQSKGSGPAVGFGQMEIYNKDKVPFFEWLGFNSDRKKVDSLPLITPEKITGDYDFSVKLTCKYFQWLISEGYKYTKNKTRLGTVGALKAQTGPGANETFVPVWRNAEKELQSVLYAGDRMRLIRALNLARSGGPHPNPIPFQQFKAYWDFTVPESELILGFRE